MRITRSTLRRIIAEESARILAETKKKDSHERIPGGHQARIEAGFDEEPEEEDWDDEGGDDDFFGEDGGVSDANEEGSTHGWELDPETNEWRRGDEVADEALAGVLDMYGHPDPYGDDEAQEMGYEYDGAGGWKKPGMDEGEVKGKGKKHSMTPREKLGRFLATHDVDARPIYKVIDAVIKHAERSGEEASSESVTFKLPDSILYSLPDSEEEQEAWHNMLDAVLNDEIDRSEDLDEMKKKKPTWQDAAEKGGKDCLYILYGGRSVYYIVAPSGLTEEEAEAQAIEVTGDIAGDESMADPLELYEWLADHDFITTVHDPESVGGEVSKAEFMEQLRAVGEEEGLFAPEDEINEGEEDMIDEGDDSNWDDDLGAQSEYQHALDVGDEAHADIDTGSHNAFTQRGFKGRGPAPRISGDDSDSGDDEMGGGDAAMADYEHAWNIGGGADEEGFAADYDTGGRNKFTKMGMRGRSSLSEARWAKLAGILKG